MKFFKHFTDAHRGQSLQLLKRKRGFEAIGRYWALVEMCAEKLEKRADEEFTAEHCVFVFDKSLLMQSLGYHNHTTTLRYLDDLAVIGLCSVRDDGETYVCSMPKLLECLDRDTKRARTERAMPAPKIKNKDKDKELDKDKEYIKADDAKNLPALAQNSAALVPFKPRDTFPISNFRDFELILSPAVKNNLASLYPDFDFLKREFLKMHNWLEANPKKNRKSLRGWSQFVSSWLDRGWPQYQKTIPSASNAQSTALQADISDRISKLFGDEVQDAS